MEDHRVDFWKEEAMASTEEPTPLLDTSSGRAPAPTPESRAQRFARHGRRVRLYSWAVVFVALLAVLVVLISANTRSVKLDWAIGSTHASLVWIILAAAVIGWLLGITTAVVFRRRTRQPR
jgi:uncharacterized integral membrane protein